MEVYFSSGQETEFELNKDEGAPNHVVGHTVVCLSHIHSPFLHPNKEMIFLRYPHLLSMTQGRISWFLTHFLDTSPLSNWKLCNSQNRFGCRVGGVPSYTRVKGMTWFHTWGKFHSLLFNVNNKSPSPDVTDSNDKGEVGVRWSPCCVCQNIMGRKNLDPQWPDTCNCLTKACPTPDLPIT